MVPADFSWVFLLLWCLSGIFAPPEQEGSHSPRVWLTTALTEVSCSSLRPPGSALLSPLPAVSRGPCRPNEASLTGLLCSVQQRQPRRTSHGVLKGHQTLCSLLTCLFTSTLHL